LKKKLQKIRRKQRCSILKIKRPATAEKKKICREGPKNHVGIQEIKKAKKLGKKIVQQQRVNARHQRPAVARKPNQGVIKKQRKQNSIKKRKRGEGSRKKEQRPKEKQTAEKESGQGLGQSRPFEKGFKKRVD